MRNHIRVPATFAGSCIGGIYVHEIGHALFGWLQGIPVVPTPAKEYILLAQLDWQPRAWISLGGVAATTAFVIGMLFWYLRHDVRVADSALAGAFFLLGCTRCVSSSLDVGMMGWNGSRRRVQSGLIRPDTCLIWSSWPCSFWDV